MRRNPAYVAKRTDAKIDSMGLNEVLLNVIDKHPGLNQDQLRRILVKDGVRRKCPFTDDGLRDILDLLVMNGFARRSGKKYYA